MTQIAYTEKKYHIITYGCQMNKNDSERMSGMLENIGLVNTENWQKADLVILNTCSIRDRAGKKGFREISITTSLPTKT